MLNMVPEAVAVEWYRTSSSVVVGCILRNFHHSRFISRFCNWDFAAHNHVDGVV
jgi:hypothetical protein